MSNGSDYLDALVDQVRRDKRQVWRRYSSLLSAFGYSRRRQTVVDKLNEELENKGLAVRPPLSTTLDIGSSVLFSLATEEGGPAESAEQERDIDEATFSDSDDEELRTVIETSITVGNLEAAERRPTCITPDAPVEEAITLMELREFSQLVVSTGDRSVKGVVSFRSIARAQNHGQVSYVRNCMEKDFQRVYIDQGLLEVVRMFKDSEVVLIFRRDETLSGLVTPSDIAKEFGDMAEPFFLIGEVENLLKWLISKRKLDIANLLSGPRAAPEVPANAKLLTLGDIERMVQSEQGWANVDVPYDRSVVAAALRNARELRNATMHFRDTLTEDQVQELRGFLGLVRRICVGVEKEPREAL